jgi:hypothetical protein
MSADWRFSDGTEIEELYAASVDRNRPISQAPAEKLSPHDPPMKNMQPIESDPPEERSPVGNPGLNSNRQFCPNAPPGTYQYRITLVDPNRKLLKCGFFLVSGNTQPLKIPIPQEQQRNNHNHQVNPLALDQSFLPRRHMVILWDHVFTSFIA